MGKLYVIDGTDGSGKQTQLNKLIERFKKENIKYMSIAFPNYESPSSSLVKMYLGGEFGDKASDISPYVASTFYAADRYATFKKDFEKFYNDGGIVIADRYTTANMVHQTGKIKDKKEREKFLDWLCDLEFNIYKIPKPDKVFFLNMPPEVSKKLMEDRKNKITNEEKKDLHESDENHLVDAYNAACSLVDKYNWTQIDCVKEGDIRTIEDIHEEIFSKLELD